MSVVCKAGVIPTPLAPTRRYLRKKADKIVLKLQRRHPTKQKRVLVLITNDKGIQRSSDLPSPQIPVHPPLNDVTKGTDDPGSFFVRR